MVATPADGKVLTFYSYKGGVGRSMALANVAVLLGSMGKRVLIVDWDLEAPGIEHYFQAYLRSAKGGPPPGIVELMTDGIAGKLDWRACLTHVAVAGAELHILGAGKKDDGYSKRLAAISWKDLFAADLGRYLERLRDEWTAAYDFVLVDSRTGITDIGGICTIHLPDAVIALFTANEQSLVGVAQSLRSARREHAALPVDRAKLLIIPVPARDESQSEHEKSKSWLARFATELDELYRDWLPEKVTPAQALEVLRIPYKAYWSFGEPLPVIEDGIRSPTSIGYAYALLASLIESNFDWLKMTAGRFSLPPASRPTPHVTAPVGALPKAWPWIAGAMLAALAVIAIVVIVKPGGKTHSPSIDGGRTAEEQRRSALLDAARAAKDPLTRALILRELPEDGFPADDVQLQMQGLRIPSAVFRGDYTAARFDQRATMLALTSQNGVTIVAPSGRGEAFTVASQQPSLVTFVAYGSRLIIADSAGLTIHETRAGTSVAKVDYFTTHRHTFTAAIAGLDGNLTFMLGSAVDGSGNAIFAVNAANGTAQEWWRTDRPVLAFGADGKGFLCAMADGEVVSVQAAAKPRSLGDATKGAVAAAIAEGWIAIARSDRIDYHPTARGPAPGDIFPIVGTPSAIVVGTTQFAAIVGDDIVARSGTSHPAGTPTAIAVHGNWLLSGAANGAVDLWQLGINFGHVVLTEGEGKERKPIASVGFSPDGETAVAVAGDGTVKVWPVDIEGTLDVPLAQVFTTLHTATSACLTSADRYDLLKEPAAEARKRADECVAAVRGSSATE